MAKKEDDRRENYGDKAGKYNGDKYKDKDSYIKDRAEGKKPPA